MVSMWLFYYIPWWFWHIVHATVAGCNCIAVGNFVKLVAWKIFYYQLKKYLCNVCWFAKGWVKQYFAFAFLVFLICCWCISNQHYNPTSLTHLRIQLSLYWKHQVFSIISDFWDMVYPNFHHFLIFSWQKLKQSSLFGSGKKCVCLKSKTNNDFKYRLDVKDLLKASPHWKIMSLSNISSQKVLVSLSFKP